MEKDATISFITDENGKETPIQVIKEFTRESDQKTFIIFTNIEDANEGEEQEFFAAELVKIEGSEDYDIKDLESPEDEEYCQNVFEEIQDQLFSDLGEDEE